MEKQNYLGIYLSKDAATVLCLSAHGRERNVVGCFSVSAEPQQEQNMQTLADLIAQRCAERQLKFSDVAVASDCSMFMQHNVHSEFVDAKQIASTIRFDTEEALATDVTNVAIAFNITSSDQTGSELAVFTAQRKILSDILLALQSNSIDPVTMEPDANCLARFINQQVSLPQSGQAGAFFGMLSRRNGYFITFPETQKTPIMRTFLVGTAQNRTELLARQVPLTAALVKTDEPINQLKVFDSTASVDPQQLSERLGIETSTLDLAEAAGIEPQTLADCADPVDFAIAYGAALGGLEKTQSINFRNDFSPYQGKKIRLQKILKLVSISVIVLFFALGIFFQLPLLRTNKNRSRLRDKFAEQYSAVMPGRKTPPVKVKAIANKLAGELRRIENVKSGKLSATGQQSISAKLTLILEAFNKCAAQTKLSIESISITARDIRIVAGTSSRKNTLKLFEEIGKEMEISSNTFNPKGGRDNFAIAVVLKE
ncbi:MAG: hypothetical protein ACYS1A_12310 [Planctomycetota bacterium]